jgi:hypothetical protein
MALCSWLGLRNVATAGFHDLEFTGCAVPDYVTAALEIQGLGGTQPAATTGPHTVWRYDEDKQVLC